MSNGSAPDRRSPSFQVLGPVTVRSPSGEPVDVRGPRHRAVLARLLVARGRMVPLATLVDDLWDGTPPANPAGAVRTFVAALRVALEPDRVPRTPPRLLVTRGPGYALDAPADAVDAGRFEQALADAPDDVQRLERALAMWHGPAYADVADAVWARAERGRLGELRLTAVERLGRARLAAGRPAAAVPDLDAHVTEHPWREEGWRLLATALYRADRRGDALAVLRRARALLAEELGTDPGPGLARLETEILRGDVVAGSAAADRVWAGVTTAWERTPIGARATLESATGLLRSLAVHGGGPATAFTRHAATVAAAEELGDPELTARVIGGYDVPSVWFRSDDPAASATVTAAAERTLRRLADGAAPAVRARLLTAVAVETRGLPDPRGREAAERAEALARAAGDPSLLAATLAGRVVQSFHRAGLAPARLAVGEELIDLAGRHDLPVSAVLGHLTVLQARCAVGDLDGAGAHAAVLTDLGRRLDSPLVDVFVDWFHALRAAEAGAPDAEARYRAADSRLAGGDMPGVRDGLLGLALACVRLRRGAPLGDPGELGGYRPWVLPHLLLARGRGPDDPAVVAAVRDLPDPPPGHLLEALWCLAGRAALAVGDETVAARAEIALAPAAGELAGAASGMVTLGPVRDHLDELRHR